MCKFRATMFNTRGQYPLIVHVHGEAKDWIAFVRKAREYGKSLWLDLRTTEIGVVNQENYTSVTALV